MSCKVFIAPGDSYNAAIVMFERAGFEVTKDYEGVELVCFLGGTDVDPATYGEERGPFTQSPDIERDRIEVALYERFKDVPKVGICRGGQLLNVLNGGKMIQHLGEYISGDVGIYVGNDDFHNFRVDHHQGIISNDLCKVDSWNEGNKYTPDFAGYYESTKSLFFQGHPEWGHEHTEDYFFELIERHFGFVRKAP